jgi:hypothetical protein
MSKMYFYNNIEMSFFLTQVKSLPLHLRIHSANISYYTFCLLLVGNLSAGVAILTRRTEPKYRDIFGDDLGRVVVHSIAKSGFYAAFWGPFWSLSTLKCILFPYKENNLNLESKYIFRYNRNGLLPHFIPDYASFSTDTEE